MPKDEPTSHKKSHKKEKKKLKSVCVDTDQPVDASKAGVPSPPLSRPEEKAIAAFGALVNKDAVPHETVPFVAGRDHSRYVMFRCASRHRRMPLLQSLKPYSYLKPVIIFTSQYSDCRWPM